MRCNRCDATLGDGLNFCTSCGAPAAVAAASPMAAPPPVSPPPPEPGYGGGTVGGQWAQPQPAQAFPQPAFAPAELEPELAVSPGKGRSKLLPIVAGVAVVGLLVGGGLWLLGRDDNGGSASGGGGMMRGLRSEPQEAGEFKVDGDASVAAVVGSTIVMGRYDYDQGVDEVVAVDLATGDELWSERGTATVLGSTVYVLDDGRIQPYTLAGEKTGEVIRVSGSYLYGLGSYLGTYDYESSQLGVIEPSSGESVDHLESLSSNMAFGLEVDYNDSDVELQVVRVPSGEKFGEGFDVSSSGGFAVLDNGRIVVLDDGELLLYNENGEELATADADDAWSLSAKGNLVFTEDDNEAAIFDAGGNTLVEFKDTIDKDDGYLSTQLSANGVLAIVEGDSDVLVYRVVGGTITELFSTSGSLWGVATDVVYISDDGDLAAWSTGGGTDPLWELSGSGDGGFRPLDGAVAEREYDSADDETTVVIYR